LVWNTVAVAIQVNVVIEKDLSFAHLSVFVRCER
jgi:hypothetical protein